MRAQPDRSPPSPLAFGGEWLKIGVLGFLLALALFVVFFFRPASTAVGTASAVEETWDATPVPDIDMALLEGVNDASRSGRLKLEREPYRHLLQKSLAVTPSVARKLGMPEQALPLRQLRSSPQKYRGRYLWYKGQLEYLSTPKPHPEQGYDAYEVRIRTSDGEAVLGSVAVLPEKKPLLGDWVRLEGYFLKLRDTHLPVQLDLAPMLVGPYLFEAYPDWAAVTAIDPAVLNRIDDGEWKGGPDFEGGADIDKLLSESQDDPLWHLASFALAQAGERSDESWQDVPAFATPDQLESFRHGKIARGTPMRVLGTFVHARVMPADVNPLEIDAWTEAWIQVRDLGGKTVPVWVPRRIADDWRQNQSAMVFGYYFKRYRYEATTGDVRWTPLFVAADIKRFELSRDVLSNQVTIAFAVLTGIVALMFFVMARLDRRRHMRFEADLVERRRKRRSQSVATSVP